MDCMWGNCYKCWGWMLIVLGALVLINDWWLGWTWATFIGVVLILKGLLGLYKPYCPHCEHHGGGMMKEMKKK